LHEPRLECALRQLDLVVVVAKIAAKSRRRAPGDLPGDFLAITAVELAAAVLDDAYVAGELAVIARV
jgi:hypothetical protein